MEKRYPALAIGSFVALALWGVILRLMFIFPLPGLNYTFLLHAHSHFAFSAWVFLSLAILTIHEISETKISRSFHSLLIATLLTSIGMLVSFSLQGYKAVSIVFSTLFILINFYFCFIILRNKSLPSKFNSLSLRLLKSSLVYLCLSAIGPLSLGPLIAAGLKNAPVYHNAIYFYLHFQMNGWMLMSVLAVTVNRFIGKATVINRNERRWADLFIWSTLPLFLIFTLWSNTNGWIRVTAFAAAFFNLISWIKLLQILKKRQLALPPPAKVALIALTTKIFFQTLICIPALGNWVFSQRNIIIGYIHLLTLGTISPLILQLFTNHGFLQGKGLRFLHSAFIGSVIIYLLILFLQPFLALFFIQIPHYQVLLGCISAVLLIEGCLYLVSTKNRRR